MNYNHFGVFFFVLFSIYYEIVAEVNVALKDDHEEVKKYKSLKSDDSYTTLKATTEKTTTKEVPLNELKDSNGVTSGNPVEVLDTEKVIKKEETGSDRGEDEENLSDFYIVGDNSYKNHDLDHKAGHIDVPPLEDKEKEAETTDSENVKNDQQQRYKRTGTVFFYEEVDHVNNDTDNNLPTLNIYVNKDKSINIGNHVDDDKPGKSTNKKQNTIVNLSNIEGSGKSEVVDDSKRIFPVDASSELRNGDPDMADESNIIAVNTTNLTEVSNSKSDDEICDITINNDYVHEVIERNEYPYVNPLFTKVEHSLENIQPNQSPTIQDNQNIRKCSTCKPNNPYMINYVNGNLRYVPPQAGYPQGYYTDNHEKYAKPYFNSKPANLQYVDYINQKVYRNGNYLNLHNPDYSRLPPPFRYQFQNQFKDLSENHREKYNDLNFEKSPYSWSGNYQGKPIGYSIYNPSNQFGYQEVIQSQNSLDKIWRSWRRTQIILKDLKNQVNTMRNTNIPRNSLNKSPILKL